MVQIITEDIFKKYGATPVVSSVVDDPYKSIFDKYGATPVTQQGTFYGTSQTISELMKDPLSLKANPTKVIGDAWNSIKGAVEQEGQNISNLFKSKSVSEGIGHALESVAGAVGLGAGALGAVALGASAPVVAGLAAFPFITAFFNGANDIPVLGSVSRLITVPFQAAGEAGAGISGGIIDQLPIPQEAKDNIKPGIQEIFALAAQLALGKVADIGVKGYKGELPLQIRTEFVKRNPELAQDLNKVPDGIIKKMMSEKGKEDTLTMLRESIKLSKETNPVDEIFKKYGATEVSQPLVQETLKYGNNDKVLITDKTTGESAERFVQISKKGDLLTKNGISGIPKKIDISKFDIKLIEKNSAEAPKKGISINSPEMIALETQSPIPSKTIGTGELVPRGFSETLRENAIRQGVTGDIVESPLYQTREMPIAKVDEYVSKVPLEESIQVARGLKSAPEGLLPSEIATGLERKALKENDLGLINSLIEDKQITSLATEYGRIVKGYDSRFDFNPIKNIRDINKNLEEMKGGDIKIKKVVETETSKMKETIKKSASSKEAILEEVKKLKC